MTACRVICAGVQGCIDCLCGAVGDSVPFPSRHRIVLQNSAMCVWPSMFAWSFLKYHGHLKLHSVCNRGLMLRIMTHWLMLLACRCDPLLLCARTCRDQLLQRYRKRESFLEVDLRVLSAYDLVMHDLILKQPNEYIPVVRWRGCGGVLDNYFVEFVDAVY